jgi:hypothetical protein
MNTIGWGQALNNNNLDWGNCVKKNNLSFGFIYDISYSGETVIV